MITFWIVFALFLVCLAEGGLLYFSGRKNAALKKEIAKTTEAMLSAKRELRAIADLMERRFKNEKEARDEKQKLEETSDEELAHRANRLFP